MKTKRRRRKGSGQIIAPARGKARTWGYRLAEKYVGGYATRDEATQALDVAAERLRLGLPDAPEPALAVSTLANLVPSFLAQRGRTRRDDTSRWRNLEGIQHLTIDAVGPPELEALVSKLRAKPLTGASIERVLYLLSAFYRWHIRMTPDSQPKVSNPVTSYLNAMERTDRDELRSQHDWRDTPFLEDRQDIVRLYRELPETLNYAYALGSMAGLRPGEALALEWADVDLKRNLITVRQSVRHGIVGPTKSKRVRKVPITPSLASILSEWRPRCTSKLVVSPKRGNGHLDDSAVQDALDVAFFKLGINRITNYEASRHTFASHWVLAGQDIYRLSKILGHSSVETTKRYAHLTDKVPASVLAAIDLGMTA